MAFWHAFTDTQQKIIDPLPAFFLGDRDELDLRGNPGRPGKH
jgi:hypothetical protein